MTLEQEEILVQGFLDGDFKEVRAVWEIGGTYAFVGRVPLSHWQGGIFEVSLPSCAVMRNRDSLAHYWG